MAYAPATDVGTLKLIPEASRTAIVSGFTTVGTGWNDVQCPVPAGTKAVMFEARILFTGDGTTDQIFTYFRKNGSSETTNPNIIFFAARIENLGAGLDHYAIAIITVEVDSNGIFEHRDLGRSVGGAAAGDLSCDLIGYYS